MTITKEQAWGRGGLMALAAFRYCLGRQTYIVSDCADWLVEVWLLLDDGTKTAIKRDLEQAFKHDDQSRDDGCEHKELGADCDRAAWEKVRELFK